MIAADDQPAVAAAVDIGSMEAPIVYPAARRSDAKQPKGKGSKWNSLRHGLMSRTLFGADLAARIDQCTADLTVHYQPTTAHEVDLIKDMGRAKAQIDHGRNLKVVNLQRTMDRAILCWDKDRCEYIYDLAARLPKDPMRVARALERTKQGVEWLIGQWLDLGEALEVAGRWTDEQRSIAFDLLGVRPEMRLTSRKVAAATETGALKALVMAELDRLVEELEVSLNALDSATQAYAAAGGPMEEDLYTRNLRKYEASASRDYYRARAELLAGRAGCPSPAAVGPVAATPAETSAPTVAAASLEAEAESEIRARPRLSKAAQKFVIQSFEQFQLEPAASGMAPQEGMSLSVPLALDESGSGIDPQPEPEPEPEPGPVAPRPAAVGKSASPSVNELDRRDRERRQARALEKRARKAARRRRR